MYGSPIKESEGGKSGGRGVREKEKETQILAQKESWGGGGGRNPTWEFSGRELRFLLL